MFIMNRDGSLTLNPAFNQPERAAWNVVLLRLDLHDSGRARLQEMLDLVEQLGDSAGSEPSERERVVLDIIERELAERLPLIRAFEIPLSPRVRSRLDALDAARRGA